MDSHYQRFLLQWLLRINFIELNMAQCAYISINKQKRSDKIGSQEEKVGDSLLCKILKSYGLYAVHSRLNTHLAHNKLDGT